MSVLVRNDPVVVETARVDQGVKTSADNETEENVPQGGEPDLGTRDLHMETEGNKDDHQKDVSTLEKVEAELRDEEGINGALADQSSKKDADGKPWPREEASSELQKEGIRLKIKIPPHRRNKLKAKGQQKEASQGGRSLRRSARISRFVTRVKHQHVNSRPVAYNLTSDFGAEKLPRKNGNR